MNRAKIDKLVFKKSIKLANDPVTYLVKIAMSIRKNLIF